MGAGMACLNGSTEMEDKLAMEKENVSVDARRAFSAALEEQERASRERPAIRDAGVEALKRLVNIAQGHSGQCRYVAAFLLGLYNGNRFKFDLTEFRALDRAIFNDCMAVLLMDYELEKEVHCYFDEGGRLWEHLAKDWNIMDYSAMPDGQEQRNDQRSISDRPKNGLIGADHGDPG